MAIQKLSFRLVIIAFISLISCLSSMSANAEEEDQYGYVTDLKPEDIPEGDFTNIVWPQETPEGIPVFRVTQVYNQSESEKWQDPGSGAWFWGHDGIDVHEDPTVTEGTNYNRSLLHGLVIAAVPGYRETGWGYRMTIATRVPYSHQIITVNYAHMYDKDGLFFSPGDTVSQGERIGLEGSTGWGTGAHVHISVRVWDRIEDLKAAIDKDDAVDDQKLNGGGLFQSGYVYNSVSRLANYLSPYYLITGKFLEFECNDPGCPTWAKAHALAARRAGIDFGRYDGYFALDTTLDGDPRVENLTRGESVRWYKVARKFDTHQSGIKTFTDVATDSAIYPYVDTLLANGVLSPTADCNPSQSGMQFCEDIPRTRAEQIKMIVETFMSSEFTYWQSMMMQGVYYFALQGVSDGEYFQDLYDPVSNTYHWATTYVLFAAFATTLPPGIKPVDRDLNFRPEDPVNKLEAVKMLMTVREWFFQKYGEQSQYDLCDYHYCGIDQACIVLPEEGYEGPYHAVCQELPGCVPEEGGRDDCKYGGGYIPDECDGNQNPVCAPGESKSQPCGNGGTQNAVCTSQCLWSDWGECLNQGSCTPGQTQTCGNCGQMTCQSDYTWSTCQGQGVCTPGNTQSQTCNYTGTQTQTCLSTCAWSAWSACSVQTECTPGQTQTQSCTVGGQPGTQTRVCDAYGQWGSWSSCQSSCECSSGICCDGCYYRSSSYECDSWNEYRCEGTAPGDDAEYMKVSKYCSGNSSYCNGATDQTPWYTLEFCSADQQCVINGQTPTCEDLATCTDTYCPSGKTACFDQNPNGVEICLSIQRVSGSTYQFRVCKTGTFQNSFSYEIKDILNPGESPIYTGTGSSGVSCTSWKTVDFSYIPGYGSGDGATIRADVKSPANTGTLYRSSIMKIYKQCL